MTPQPPFLQNSWYWWETNDKYIWAGIWQVLEAKSININKSSKYFYNSNWYLPKALSEFALSSNITQTLIWSSFTNRLTFFNDWNIFNSTSDVTPILDTNKNIVNAWVIWTKWFIINGSSTLTGWTIDSWTYNTNAIDLWLSTITLNVLTWLTINTNFAPFYITDFRIYLATWINLYIINPAWWILEKTITVLDWWQIRWLTKIWNQYNIYVNYWSSSKQYIWNWNVAIDTEINWVDRSILNVATINNVDYVICDDGLYIANWYQPTCLYQRTFISEFTNAIETYRNKIFIPWYKCVYTYQFNKPWFPWNLTTELITPTTTGSVGISCMFVWLKTFDNNIQKYTQNIYICYWNFYIKSSSKQYIIQYTNDSFLQDRNAIWWSSTINPIIWIKWDKKANKKIRLGYYLNSSIITEFNDITYANVTKTFYFKHSIWIFAQKDEQTKVCIYIWWFTTKPTVWSVYTIGSRNSTITNINYLFEANSAWHWWLELEMVSTTNLNYVEKTLNSLTKVSWTGDSSWIYMSLHYWEIVFLYTDNNMNWKSVTYTGDYNQITFTIHITEWDLQADNAYLDERLQTRVYDFAFLSDKVQYDLI